MGRAEPVCSNNDCRQYFSDKGLSYNDITEGDILALVIMLNQEFKKSNRSGETSVNTIRLSEKMVLKKTTSGRLKECYLYMNSHYFTQRECISFGRDGFIGFAGWADEGNSNPIRRAFLRWCDSLAEGKEAAG